ncbi:serine/arginine-rich splicing factor SR45A isoform X2 [Tanacetum coccineum]
MEGRPLGPHEEEEDEGNTTIVAYSCKEALLCHTREGQGTLLLFHHHTSATAGLCQDPGRGRGAGLGCESYDGSDIENPGNNLYVTGLSARVTRRDLEKHFSAEGKVEDIHLVMDPRTRESRGFGFVSMSNVKEADRCIKYLDGSVLEGRVITVEKARRRRGRTPTPGRYLGLRTVRDVGDVVVDPEAALLIQGVVLLVTHLRETGVGAGHTLRIIVAGVADHTAVAGPTLVLDPLIVGHRLADTDLIPRIITIEGADTILGLTVQKTVTTGEAGTTRGTIHQTTIDRLIGATGIIRLSTGAAGAGVTGLFLEVCRLLQGGITGASLRVSPQLDREATRGASHPHREARGGATLRVCPLLGVLTRVGVLGLRRVAGTLAYHMPLASCFGPDLETSLDSLFELEFGT